MTMTNDLGLLKIKNEVTFHDLRQYRHFRPKLGRWNECAMNTEHHSIEH